jgi:hypothetical protein
MSRRNTLAGAVLVVCLLFASFIPAFGQTVTSEEILKWEPEIAVFDSLNLVEPTDTGTILVTGSSSVRLWDSIHTDLLPYQVIQRGYGGAKLTDFNYYEKRIIKPEPFKAIVVFVANDIAGEEMDLTPKEVLRQFKELVRQIRDRNPGTPVCWIEITPTPKRWQVSPEIREANGRIKTYCERHDDLHFISTYDHYITPEGVPDSTLFREDMLHLNRDGYLLWAELIKTALEEAGITP